MIDSSFEGASQPGVARLAVNSEAKMREMIDAGIERFYTDDPRLLLKVWGK